MNHSSSVNSNQTDQSAATAALRSSNGNSSSHTLHHFPVLARVVRRSVLTYSTEPKGGCHVYVWRSLQLLGDIGFNSCRHLPGSRFFYWHPIFSWLWSRKVILDPVLYRVGAMHNLGAGSIYHCLRLPKVEVSITPTTPRCWGLFVSPQPCH
jgi:hypothetical protein